MNTEELKKLAMAATPGPWAYSNDSKDFPVNGYVTVRDCIYSVCVLPYEGIRTDDRVTDNGLFIAAANPTAILALIAEIARFTQDAEMAAASLNLITGHHEHLLAEFDRVTKERDELLAAWKEYQNADFSVSCQRGVVGKCMCAQCTNDRASAVFSRAEG